MHTNKQTMAQDSIGVAVVGTGFGQKIHIPGFQAHHRTEVVAVYHRDPAKAQEIAQAHHIPHACHTVEDVAALPEVQAVSVATPPFLHYDMAKTVLAAGKHLFLEKPTALSVAEAKDLHQLAVAQKVAVALDFEFRFVPAWQHFASLLADEFVGKKRLIKVDWLAASRANPQRAWNWYAQKDCGGGALGSLGSHTFDYLAWLFGPAQRLCGKLSTRIATRPDPETGEAKPVDADDSCLIMLEMADGTPCQVTISAVAYEGRGHWIEVYGDRGTLVLGNSSQTDYINGFKVWASSAGEPLAEVEIPSHLQFPKLYSDGRIAPFIRVVDHWIHCIDQGIHAGQAAAPSIAEGVYSQLLMDLTHQSNDTGNWVDISL